MHYLALGSTDDIGASCHYLNLAGTGLVLDAGVDPEEDGVDSLPDLALIRDRMERPVDHVLVTHAHHDHLGALPVLVQHFPTVGVHMTKPTQMLAEVLLPSSARLQRRRLMEGSTTARPLFDADTVEALGYIYEGHNLDATFDLTGRRGGEPVRGRFYHAGHVLGAAGVLLRVGDGEQRRRLFYTSDTHLRSQTIIPGGEYPEEPVDVLLLESTMGADEEAEQTTRREQEKLFGEAIARTLARGGTVLVPVFALGRAQEILALIDRYKRRGIVPDRTPVYTNGQMRAVADLYDRTRLASPRLNPDFEVFGVDQQRFPRSDERARQAIGEPSIHVTSSGMLFERTLSNKLAQRLVEDERHGIFFVGFSKEGSPGDRLQRAAAEGTEVVLDEGNGRAPQPVRAEVGRFRFSGHSHRQDLIELVGRLRPKKIVLVHGETEAKRWMRDTIQRLYPGTEVILPQQGVEIEV
ncbi:MAG: MBL fold metallo-hydrolase [Bacteroidota bacterium]